MGNCDSCGKKFGWREFSINIGEYVAFVIEQNIQLTKFDKPLLQFQSGLKHQIYCVKCVQNFFIPYARQYALVQKTKLSDYNYTQWTNNTGVDVYKHAMIIHEKINKAKQELRERKLESRYSTAFGNSMYKLECDFLDYHELGMKWDAEYETIVSYLDMPHTESSGTAFLLKKYRDSSYEKFDKEIEDSYLNAELKGRSPI
jgi:hypothetical protein